MKKLVCVLLLIAAVYKSNAQSTEDSVKQVVRNLFAAMKGSNGTAIESCFWETAILQTITRNEGIKNEDVKEFAASINKLPKDSCDEQIVFETIKVDAGLAVVWTPYKFYYAGKFSHCGVNSFQLLRQKGVWKIQYLIDTRRKTACP